MSFRYDWFCLMCSLLSIVVLHGVVVPFLLLYVLFVNVTCARAFGWCLSGFAMVGPILCY